MTMFTVRKTLAAAAIAAGALTLTTGAAQAQTAPVVPPPTVPCDGCGGNPAARGTGQTVWAWPDHHCNDMGQSSYSVTVGVGRNVPGPQTFEWRDADPSGDPTWRFLATVQPGRQAAVYPVVTVEPYTTVAILVRVRGGAVFASGGDVRTFVLTCPCDQPPTTPPSSSPPSSAVTTAPPVTAPATTVPGTTPTVPGTSPTFELPATGSTTPTVVMVGLLASLAGGAALVLVKRGK